MPLVPGGAETGRRRLAEAGAATAGGLSLPEVVGGYGVAQVALEALRLRGLPVPGARAVLQGFGSIGGSAARYLAAAGVRVVGVADVDGHHRAARPRGERGGPGRPLRRYVRAPSYAVSAVSAGSSASAATASGRKKPMAR
ncbi:MAG: hypothetical protein GEV11_28295 [Streptosporangiales bacterium]|nr:hypothetical protein [Streptosporangiales bacterium]